MFKKLFGKKEEESKEKIVEEKEHSNTFVSFALLNEARYDFEKFRADFKKDWNISLDDYEDSDDSEMFVFDHDGMMIAISIMPAQIPNDEAVFHARTNRVWDDAVNVAEAHKAHLLISVLGRDAEMMDVAKMFVKVCSSAINQENTTALDSLGKKDLEIIDSKENAEDVYSLITDISLYVIDYDAILLDGETIGFTEDQKLSLTESPAVALDPTINTIKIGY